MRGWMAEAVGTAMLALAALGSAQAAAQSGIPVAPAVAAAAGLMLFVTITLFIPVSGGHLNPIITLLFWARGDTPTRRALAWLSAQLAGAMAGLVLVHLLFGLPLLHIAGREVLGRGTFLAESLTGMGFTLVVSGGLRAAPPLIPALSGAFGAVAVIATSSGGFANPAVMVARMLTGTPGGVAAPDALALMAAQVIGAALGVALGRWLFFPAAAAQSSSARSHS